MKNVKEIVETMISFDIFFQEKNLRKANLFSAIFYLYIYFLDACLFYLMTIDFLCCRANMPVTLMIKISDAFYFYF